MITGLSAQLIGQIGEYLVLKFRGSIVESNDVNLLMYREKLTIKSWQLMIVSKHQNNILP